MLSLLQTFSSAGYTEYVIWIEKAHIPNAEYCPRLQTNFNDPVTNPWESTAHADLLALERPD